MSIKGTGIKDRLISKAKEKYKREYKVITTLAYFFKDNTNYKGLRKLDNTYKKSIKKYWKKYRLKIDFNEFKFYSSKSKIYSPKYITKRIYHSEIEPKLNDIIYSEVFSNKNYLDLILKGANLPTTVIKKIDGILLNDKYETISLEEAYKLIINDKMELIYKPAIDSCGGKNIIFLNNSNKNELAKDLISNKDNFIIQHVIKQHKEFAKFNESSINTVRVMSFLYKKTVHILYMVLRIGKEGMRVDNASAGGMQIVIKNDGSFANCIVNVDNEEINDEVLANLFANKKLPFYNEIITEVKKLHPLISNCKLAGWDVTIDESGKPVIVEVNLNDIGMTDKSQSVNGPLFGDLTDDVLNDIFKN